VDIWEAGGTWTLFEIDAHKLWQVELCWSWGRDDDGCKDLF
jgi:hypothetical protein